MSQLPLAGRRIVVTRAREQAAALSAELRKLGAEVIEIPTIEIVPPASYEPVDAALRNPAQFEWLLLTSANAVAVLAERLAFLGLDASALAPLRKAAVGAATARAMQEKGLQVDVVPQEYVAESLVEALREQVRGKRILLARAAVARDIIPEELAAAGAQVEVVDVYRNMIPAESVQRVREVFAPSGELPDAVTFASSSTVKNFMELIREAGLGGVPTGPLALSIGPITSSTLRKSGWPKISEAVQHDLDGLIRICREALSP